MFGWIWSQYVCDKHVNLNIVNVYACIVMSMLLGSSCLWSLVVISVSICENAKIECAWMENILQWLPFECAMRKMMYCEEGGLRLFVNMVGAKVIACCWLILLEEGNVLGEVERWLWKRRCSLPLHLLIEWLLNFSIGFLINFDLEGRLVYMCSSLCMNEGEYRSCWVYLQCLHVTCNFYF